MQLTVFASQQRLIQFARMCMHCFGTSNACMLMWHATLARRCASMERKLCWFHTHMVSQSL